MDPWVIGLYVASGVLVFGAVIFLSVKKHRYLSAQVQRCVMQMEALEKSIALQNTIAIGMGQRILSLEQKIKALRATNGETPTAEDLSYSQAMQMFERGLDAATVSASCGISRSEAQLMELIRKQAKQPQKESLGVV